MKMLQVLDVIMAMCLYVAKWCRLLAVEGCMKINIILVLWSYVVIKIGDSGGQECYSWKIISATKMNEEYQCMPPSQALQHSKLMRPDKH